MELKELHSESAQQKQATVDQRSTWFGLAAELCAKMLSDLVRESSSEAAQLRPLNVAQIE